MVLEYRVNWAGTAITGPGVTVFHGRDSATGTLDQAAEELAERARAFFAVLPGMFPNGITWEFPGEAVELNTTTGTLESVHVFTPPADVVSSGGTGNYARPVGARVDWYTDAIVAGRRLRGRTFLVPLGVGAYDAQGTISTASIAVLQSAADAYTDPGVGTNVEVSVWSRTHGVQGDITSQNIPDEAAVLRSRRD